MQRVPSQDDATVKCWGNNGNGRLGYGDTANRGDEPDGACPARPTVSLPPPPSLSLPPSLPLSLSPSRALALSPPPSLPLCLSPSLPLALSLSCCCGREEWWSWWLTQLPWRRDGGEA